MLLLSASNASVEDWKMRTGGFELSDEEAEDYLAALKNYGIERSNAFLRQCAFQLIKHSKAGDELTLPLDFKLSKNPKPH